MPLLVRVIVVLATLAGGAVLPAPAPAASAVADVVEALVIGDSVLDALSQSGGARAREIIAARHSVILDTRGCRRINSAGCVVNSVPAPPSGMDALRARAGQFSRAVVMGAGYNDLLQSDSVFANTVDVVLAEARSQRVPFVLWLTYRESGPYTQEYIRHNEILRKKATEHSEMRIVEWSLRSAELPRSWFSSDGIHMGRDATIAMATLIAESLSAAAGAGPTALTTPDAVPTARPGPFAPGHVSPIRCYGDTWTGRNPVPAPAEIAEVPAGGVHLLDPPVRLADTRNDVGKLGPRRVLSVPVHGVEGVPSTATGAVVTVTSVEPCAAGYLAVFPCGSGVPNSAILNANAESTVSNSAVVLLGGGAICVFANEPTDVIVDLTGWTGPGGAGTEFVRASRLVDTRAGQSQAIPVPQQRLRARTGLTVGVAQHRDVGWDATAVSVNITAVGAATAGFLTALPGACPVVVPPPTTATLTTSAARDVAAAATVGIRGGAMCIYSNVDVDVVIDLQAVHRNDDLVTPVPPERLVDTRVTGLVPDTGLDLDVLLRQVPADATGLVVNIAAVEPATNGFAVVYACNLASAPFVSNLNYSSTTTVSNRAVVSLELGRKVCVKSSTRVHLVIDVEAWLTSPVPLDR